jgi:hypothetical protein
MTKMTRGKVVSLVAPIAIVIASLATPGIARAQQAGGFGETCRATRDCIAGLKCVNQACIIAEEPKMKGMPMYGDAQVSHRDPGAASAGSGAASIEGPHRRPWDAEPRTALQDALQDPALPYAQPGFLHDYEWLVRVVLYILLAGGVRKLGASIVKVAIVVPLCLLGAWVLGAVLEVLPQLLVAAFFAGLIVCTVLLSRYARERWPEALAQIELVIGVVAAALTLQVFLMGDKDASFIKLINVLLGAALTIFNLEKAHAAYVKVRRADDGNPVASPSKPQPRRPKAG